MFTPKLFTALKYYSKERFLKDLTAGIIVGIVALPLAIAFGIASGASPERGIITAIIAGFLISALGGSRVQIGGPTGAFIIIILGIIREYGIDGLIIATIIAGILLIIMGLLKLGDVIKFIPFPVTVGFTSGIAVVIFSTQIKDFFGFRNIGELPAHFIEQIIFYFQVMHLTNYYALILSLLTILIIVYSPKITTKIPGSLFAIIITTLIAYYFKLPVDTIGSRFGEIASSFPKPVLPLVDFETVNKLLPAAFTIAVLGAIESLLSATVADGMISGNHRSNTELIAQGVANIVTPIFGGIPATGAIARTVTNIKNGAQSPVAGIIHSIVLLLIFLFFGKLAALVPMACLAGILTIVAYNMSEWRSFKALFKGTKSDTIVLLTTFLLTVIFDLIIAIEVGLLISMVIIIRRITLASDIKIISGDDDKEDSEQELTLPKGVDVYEINGPFFFGIAHKFNETIRTMKSRPKVRILRLRKVPFIDSTALNNLKELFFKSKKSGEQLILSGLNEQPLKILKNSGLYDLIGAENICKDIYSALRRAQNCIGEK